MMTFPNPTSTGMVSAHARRRDSASEGRTVASSLALLVLVLVLVVLVLVMVMMMMMMMMMMKSNDIIVSHQCICKRMCVYFVAWQQLKPVNTMEILQPR